MRMMCGRDKGVFLLCKMSTKALGPTQPPVQCIMGTFAQGCEADNSPHLKMKLQIHGAIPQLHYVPYCLIKCGEIHYEEIVSIHNIIATIKLCIGRLYFFHYIFYKHNGDVTP